MTTMFLRVAWSAAAQTFRDLTTGRFISASVAAPFLRAMPRAPGDPSVVLRDALGHFVPMRFFGGDVQKHYITGAGNYAAIRRGIVDPEVDWLRRSHDHLTAHVTVQTVTGQEVDTWVTMPRDTDYDEDIFEDRLASRMTSAIGAGTDRYDTVPMYGISKIEWSVTSYYAEGQSLGGDVNRFGGFKGA